MFHFTPTSSSWLNAVEDYFAKLATQRLKRGVFRSVDDLKHAIKRFIAETNGNPKPFAWTGSVAADAQKLLLWFSPSDLTRRTFKGLFCAFEIRPSFETVPLGKGGFMGVQ